MSPHNMPAAEFDVSPGLVRRLVADQQPGLAHLPVEVMSNGWDNALCRVGGELIARLPRREMAAQLVAHEQRWLPVLAPRLPLAVPAPVHAGRPGLGYPWPWSIVPFLPGQVASLTPPAAPADAGTALGAFLAALHVPAEAGAPVNHFRGIPLAGRTGTVLANLDAVGGRVDRSAVTRAWEAALAAPVWDGPPVWLHGDLHPANVLVHQGRISAVIDFGDLTAGDPAGDLSAAWMLLPAAGRDAFQAAYAAAGGPAEAEGIWARARGWALALALVFLAHSADNPAMERIGRVTLTALLA